jgi:hypothetical protein
LFSSIFDLELKTIYNNSKWKMLQFNPAKIKFGVYFLQVISVYFNKTQSTLDFILGGRNKNAKNMWFVDLLVEGKYLYKSAQSPLRLIFSLQNFLNCDFNIVSDCSMEFSMSLLDI